MFLTKKLFLFGFLVIMNSMPEKVTLASVTDNKTTLDKPSPPQSHDTVIQYLFEILESGRTKDYIGESVSQLEHALQTAYVAYLDPEADSAVIAAALLHDIWHLAAPTDAPQMDGYGVADHDTAGAKLLRDFGFGEEVWGPVQGHVEAKRYRVTSDPTYIVKVSVASQETLKRQGGLMTEEELKNFESRKYFRGALLLRSYEEKAKVPARDVPGLEAYRELLLACLSGDCNSWARNLQTDGATKI